MDCSGSAGYCMNRNFLSITNTKTNTNTDTNRGEIDQVNDQSKWTAVGLLAISWIETF